MESDTTGLHTGMIDGLVRSGVIRTARVEEAFRTIPRHIFLPGVPADEVYSGKAIPTRFGPDGCATSSSSMPSIMAIMLEQLEVQSGHRVLEVGTGTGYNAALLAILAGPDGAVTTVDIDPEVAEGARRGLEEAGYTTVTIRTGDGWMGDPERAPYDRIEVTVGIWDLSPQWLTQLRAGGVLVAPLWLRAGLQVSIAFHREGDRLRSVSVAPCGFMRLRGPHAGPERYVKVYDWDATLEGPGDEEIAILRDVCREPPRSEPAPPLLPGWFVPIALEESGAITLSQWKGGDRYALGIFDSTDRSLAVVEGQRILTFGGGAARARILHRLVAEPRPVGLRNLRVDAVPVAPAAPAVRAAHTAPSSPDARVVSEADDRSAAGDCSVAPFGSTAHEHPETPAETVLSRMAQRRRWTLAREHFQFVLSE